METPKSSIAYDPNRTPFNAPASRFTYLEIDGLTLMVNTDTKVVTPMPDNPYPGYPIKLPPELLEVDQPYIRTCTKGTKENRGCLANEGGGCTLFSQFGKGVGRANLIVERNNKVDSAPCHSVYCGISAQGRPTSQAHMLLDGWQILVDRTTIPENVLNPETKILEVRQTEVPNLAPWYEKAKVGRFADPVAAPKKRGRPKGSKNADRENVAPAGG